MEKLTRIEELLRITQNQLSNEEQKLNKCNSIQDVFYCLGCIDTLKEQERLLIINYQREQNNETS